MSPMERECRKLCRENGVSEVHWRAYERTTSTAAGVLSHACLDLWRNIKAALRIS